MWKRRVTKPPYCFRRVEPIQHIRLINRWCLFYEGSSQLPKRTTFSNKNKTIELAGHINIGLSHSFVLRDTIYIYHH